MSVPLNNLYHWIDSLLPKPSTIYLFYPHGSKNILDFNPLRHTDTETYLRTVHVLAHDQEPLNHSLYNSITLDTYLKWLQINCNKYIDYVKLHLNTYQNKNLACRAAQHNLYEKVILLHSEKNSHEVAWYQANGHVPVYYWCHAVIARDWYRFARIDQRLTYDSHSHKTFLIYCRDWSDRREYRLKFLSKLVETNLHQHSQVSVSKYCSKGYHYQQHEFLNLDFSIDQTNMLDQISDNAVDSSASADYDVEDFNRTQISVVLETEFDTERIHLTEKILRAIACGHPFLLAAGPLSLQYLRDYGFKTFAPWIDETYDLEQNSLARLNKIVASMQKIQQLTGRERNEFLQEVRKIAQFNKQHFFSDQFQHTVETELKTNLNQAYNELGRPRGKTYLKARRQLRQQYPEYAEFNRNLRKFVIDHIRNQF
jgi:hypothetical protein